MKACVKSSRLWSKFQVYSLAGNHRLERDDAAHSKWLLDIGNDCTPQEEGMAEDYIKIPCDMLSKNSIVDDIFPSTILPHRVHQIQDYAILCPTNEKCKELNAKIIDRIEGEKAVYYSVHNIVSDDADAQNLFPLEFIHTLEPSGMPPHLLELKVGCVVILIRNLDGKIHVLLFSSTGNEISRRSL